jgi:hypothetical protein
MGQHATAKVMQPREVEAGVGPGEAEGIRPIHTAADGIRRLAVGQPFAILPHHDQGYAPGRHLHRPSLGRIAIGTALIIGERAALGTPIHIEVAVGKGSLHGGGCGLWDGW